LHQTEASCRFKYVIVTKRISPLLPCALLTNQYWRKKGPDNGQRPIPAVVQ
jgi:hypothetical protein